MLPSTYPEVQALPRLQSILARQVDMQFVDLRTMLRLPLPDLEGGCNFAAAATIFNIIGGASFCFFQADLDAFEAQRGSGRRFKEMLNAYYPWHREPLPKDRGVTLLYKSTRNPLTHALGLDAARASDPIISIGKGRSPRNKSNGLKMPRSARTSHYPPFTATRSGALETSAL